MIVCSSPFALTELLVRIRAKRTAAYTALRSVGEVALHGPMKANEYEEIIGSMLEELNGLTLLVETLLLISRMHAGLHLKLRQCHLS